MSLTGEVRQADSLVRRFIDQHFPHLQTLTRESNERARSAGLVTLPTVHANRSVSALVGTATDYRVRAYFNRNIFDSPAVMGGLTILSNIKELKKPFINPETGTNITPIAGNLYWEEHEITQNPWYWRRRNKIAQRLLSSYSYFVARIRPERRKLTPEIEERLCRYCVLFAYFDWIHRGGSRATIERLINIGHPRPTSMLKTVDAAIVRDIAELSKQFYTQNRPTMQSFKQATLGATFMGSPDIGGADCDLILDGCLLDLKTTTRAYLETNHLRQLVGYWLLDYDDLLHLSSAAIVLLRHGFTHRFRFADLIGPSHNPNLLRRDFRNALTRLKSSSTTGPANRGH